MSTPILPENAPDAVEATLRHYVKDMDVDIEYALQDHPAAKRLINRNKQKWESGTEYQWPMTVATNDPFRHTSLYKTTPTDVSPLKVNCRVPMKYAESYFSFDDREDAFNQGAAKVYDLVESRKYDAVKSCIVGVETDFWSCPANQTDPDELEKPYGLPCYCVIATTISDGGFNGGDHAAFTSGVVNQLRSTYANLKNWCAGYRTINDEDFLDKAELAYFKTSFKRPTKAPTIGGEDHRFSYYTTWQVSHSLVKILRARNDNLKTNLDVYEGEATLGGRPIEVIPYLEANASSTADTYLGLNPFFGINWSKLFPVYHPDLWFKWGKMVPSATQNHVWNKFLDLGWNLVCVDPRVGCWVLNQLTS